MKGLTSFWPTHPPGVFLVTMATEKFIRPFRSPGYRGHSLVNSTRGPRGARQNRTESLLSMQETETFAIRLYTGKTNNTVIKKNKKNKKNIDRYEVMFVYVSVCALYVFVHVLLSNIKFKLHVFNFANDVCFQIDRIYAITVYWLLLSYGYTFL